METMHVYFVLQELEDGTVILRLAHLLEVHSFSDLLCFHWL